MERQVSPSGLRDGAAPRQPAPGAPKKGGKGKFIALGCGLLALLAILVFGGCTVLMVSSSDDSDDAAPAQSVTEDEAAAEDVPAEYTSALTSAETYSDLMNMSKQAIFDQLTSEFDQFYQELRASIR